MSVRDRVFLLSVAPCIKNKFPWIIYNPELYNDVLEVNDSNLTINLAREITHADPKFTDDETNDIKELLKTHKLPDCYEWFVGFLERLIATYPITYEASDDAILVRVDYIRSETIMHFCFRFGSVIMRVDPYQPVELSSVEKADTEKFEQEVTHHIVNNSAVLMVMRERNFVILMKKYIEKVNEYLPPPVHVMHEGVTKIINITVVDPLAELSIYVDTQITLLNLHEKFGADPEIIGDQKNKSEKHLGVKYLPAQKD